MDCSVRTQYASTCAHLSRLGILIESAAQNLEILEVVRAGVFHTLKANDCMTVPA